MGSARDPGSANEALQIPTVFLIVLGRLLCFFYLCVQGDEDEDEVAMLLESDFGRAEFLRDRLIPKAVLYFTGEAVEDDDENDDVSVVRNGREGDREKRVLPWSESVTELFPWTWYAEEGHLPLKDLFLCK